MVIRKTLRHLALYAGFLLLVGIATSTEASALAQEIEVERPQGQLVLQFEGTRMTVTDTRADDPGWSANGVASVDFVTPSFSDGAGFTYALQVSLDNDVAAAPAHHGLGIARLSVLQSAGTITLTVI